MDGSLRVKRKILLEKGVTDAIDELGNSKITVIVKCSWVTNPHI